MSIAIREFVARARALLDGKAIRVSSRCRGVCIRFTDTIIDRVVFRRAPDELDTGVLITGSGAGLNAIGVTVNHDAMICTGDSDAGERHVVICGRYVKSVSGGTGREIEGGRALDCDAAWNGNLGGHGVRAGDRDGGARGGTLNSGSGIRSQR